MRLYNVEIFDNSFKFKSSHPISDRGKYEYDYISISVNKVNVPNIDVEKGDYIIITAMNQEEEQITGVVVSFTDKGIEYEIEYKTFLSITDVDVHYDKSLLSTVTLEQWIADIISNTYVNNSDEMQNIYGLSVTYESATSNALLDLEKNIGNLYEILIKALVNYNVVVEFSIDVSQKKIKAHVSSNKKKELHIEADIMNVLDKKFNFKKSDSSYNKMTVYNSLDETESVTFYLDFDGNISTSPEASKRIIPVVFTNVFIEHKEDDKNSFYDEAYDKAFNKLSAEKYDNLIEIYVWENDKLINPHSLKIGQNTIIIHNNVKYSTILTGIEIDDGIVKLMFGTVRLELTKKIKRRKYL